VLGLFHGARPAHSVCNVFNMFKDKTRDRMIIDRRGPNSQEGRLVAGASSDIFPAYRLTELALRRGEGLRGSGTDRKDMYYQCRVSAERASTNLLGPSWAGAAVSEFGGAWAGLWERERRARERGRDRREGGDQLEQKCAAAEACAGGS